MGHWTTSCLLILALGAYAAGQACENTGGNCDDLTDIAQCTPEVFSQCCSKCNNLAGCFNLATNCFTLNYYSCHLPVTRQQCCAMCEHRKKEHLGSDCLYGDRQDGCNAGTCGVNNATDAACCETCFRGNTPVAPSAVTVVSGTTPAACTDQLSNCADTVKNVPSSCYNSDIRGVCCKACSDFLTSRQNNGYDILTCPYGDKADFCIAENFNRDNCSQPDNQFWCCDACRPLTTTVAPTTETQCMDANQFSCNLPASFCYNEFYSVSCCATCRAQIKPGLSFECRYGDNEQDCDRLISADDVCTDDQRDSCCETCAQADSCQDTMPSCSAFINGVAANCYFLGESCCATCKQFRRDHLGESCLYGDKNSGCNPNSCGMLDDLCCESCASPTMAPTTTMGPPTTTTPMCTDNVQNCRTGSLQLENNPSQCYSPGIYADCCGTCNMLKTGPATCEWGNRQSVCNVLQNIDCSNDELKNICCNECLPPTTSTPMVTTTMMMTTMAPPSNCTDKLGNCEGLTDSIYNCYPGKFVSDNCCATCFRKKKPNLPASCAWGDSLSSCGSFIKDDTLCKEDENLRRDCCETCLSFEAPTTPYQPTICPNIWSTDTCEQVLAQLGDCSSIQDKCCRTCFVTTTPAVTTPPPTTDSCIDVLDEAICVQIVTAEGADQCETDFMQERCCYTCRRLVPTTPPPTTPPACPGDALPNCAAIQALFVDDDICEMPTFRNSCCEFCGDNQSPTMAPTTTVLPPDCDGNVWSTVLCTATVTTSPLAAPCEESDLIKENCCAFCALIATTTAPDTTTTTGPLCAGDSPDIDCSAVISIVGGCDNEDLSLLCCASCNPSSSTATTMAATTPGGLCSTNTLSDADCQVLFNAGGGLVSCATDIMILSCCKFCSSLTFPPTTTAITTPPCPGDNIDVNCTLVDAQLGGNLCSPISSDLLRQACCDYCANLPGTTTTTEPTTTVCVDLLTTFECETLAGAGTCSNSFGIEQCCATCAVVNAPTTTTTTQITTTTECIDTGAFNCSYVASQGVNPCTSNIAVQQACCEFCINSTTPAPTITPPPCYGNTIDQLFCQTRQDNDPDFCLYDAAFLPLCCEFCGAPVLSSSPGTGPTNAPAVTTTTTPSGGSTAASCVADTFPSDVCLNVLQLNADSCDGVEFYTQCCKTCDDRVPSARRRRSVEDVDVEGEISRQRRQADAECTTEDSMLCEAILAAANTSPQEICPFVRNSCCEYCEQVEEALPEGKQRRDLNKGGLLAKLLNF